MSWATAFNGEIPQAKAMREEKKAWSVLLIGKNSQNLLVWPNQEVFPKHREAGWMPSFRFAHSDDKHNLVGWFSPGRTWDAIAFPKLGTPREGAGATFSQGQFLQANTIGKMDPIHLPRQRWKPSQLPTSTSIATLLGCLEISCLRCPFSTLILWSGCWNTHRCLDQPPTQAGTPKLWEREDRCDLYIQAKILNFVDWIAPASPTITHAIALTLQTIPMPPSLEKVLPL